MQNDNEKLKTAQHFSFFIFRFTFQRGYAALTTVLLVLGASLAVIGGLTFFSFQETAVNRLFVKSVDARAIAEAGIEDALWRVLSGMTIASGETLDVGKGATVVTVSSLGNTRTIRSAGSRDSLKQAITTFVDIPSSGTGFNFGVQVGDGGVTLGTNAAISGGVFSNGDITGAGASSAITGDAYAAWTSSIADVAISGNAQANLIDNVTVGGYASSTTKLDDVVVGRDAHADELDDTTVNQDAYYNVIDATSIVLGSGITPAAAPANLAPLAMPISSAMLEDWKADASCGGCTVISGDYTVSGLQNLGPAKITGNLTVSNNAHLIVSGTLWVVGDVDFGANCNISLSAGYGSTSGVIVVSGTVSVGNNCVFSGSGNPGSFLMILDEKDAPAATVITVGNGASGAVYYVANGRIIFNNNSSARAVTAYGLDLNNNTAVAYESGLASVLFSSGPSGSYDILYWKETE